MLAEYFATLLDFTRVIFIVPRYSGWPPSLPGHVKIVRWPINNVGDDDGESEAYLIRGETIGTVHGIGQSAAPLGGTGSTVVLRVDKSAWQPREKYAVFARCDWFACFELAACDTHVRRRDLHYWPAANIVAPRCTRREASASRLWARSIACQCSMFPFHGSDGFSVVLSSFANIRASILEKRLSI